MKVVQLLILLLILAQGVRAQDIKKIVLYESIGNGMEILINNLLQRRNFTQSLRNAVIGGPLTSLCQQTAWRLIEDPKKALLAQILFNKGNDFKYQSLRGQGIKPLDLVTGFRVNYLIFELDLDTQQVRLNPKALRVSATSFSKNLIMGEPRKLNAQTSLMSGTFFFGKYDLRYRRLLMWGGRTTYGSK